MAIVVWRTRQPAPPDAATTAGMTDLARAQADAAARLEAMIGMLAKAQTQLGHTVNERLDSVSHRLGDSLEKTKQSTAENLQKLNERLAVIDSAQKNITALADPGDARCKACSANKQERGAFGQGRMELIVRDGLPKGLLRIPVHAVQQAAARLRDLPARQAAAGDRFQISARSGDRLPRRQDRRRASARRRRACAPTSSSTSPTSRRNISFPARPRTWR